VLHTEDNIFGRLEHNRLQRRPNELPLIATETDWSATGCHEMQQKWS